MLKREGKPKPWSADPIFQKTYFCNVRREDDKTTQWIRNFYSKHVDDPMFEYNIILSRFLNWPITLQIVDYQTKHDPEYLEKILKLQAVYGKIWGNAYVITTHGIPMPKVQYLCRNVLLDASNVCQTARDDLRGRYCGRAAEALEGVEGIGSFLSAQVVADLKNTVGHPLFSAEDWKTFVQHGPGSLRGASWFFYNEIGQVTENNFRAHFDKIRDYVDFHWPKEVPVICNQDLQNCLCEFDKYMRVKTGTGRSKRGYDGQ